MQRNPPQVAYAAELERELRQRLRGEVRFDAGSRALYSTDASNYRQVPIGVAVPMDAADIAEALAVARRFGAPILGRGGGTSLAGQCCNAALVFDTSKYMNHILELDPERRVARVEPGGVLDDLRAAANKHGLTFGPDPATHNHCTLGGMIGNNSCGIHSLMAGRTLDNIEELEILTYDGLKMRAGATSEDELDGIIRQGGRRGEIYAGLKRIRDTYGDLIRKRFPDVPRRVSGYPLDQLLPENNFHAGRVLVGTECTCALVTEATVQLVDWPLHRSLVVLGYDNIFIAADQIPEILRHQPMALEGIDEMLVNDMKKKKLHPEHIRLLPNGAGWLLVEFGGESKKEAGAKVNRPQRLSRQTFPLSEFLERRAGNVTLPRLPRAALVHGHCHQKSLFGMHDEERVLQRLGLDYEILDSGCCGMAGAFGFEKDHYEVSIRAGERVLLPRVRAAGEGTLIITDGFSCREQIAQCTGRGASHLAEVLDMAFKSGIQDQPRAA